MTQDPSDLVIFFIVNILIDKRDYFLISTFKTMATTHVDKLGVSVIIGIIFYINFDTVFLQTLSWYNNRKMISGFIRYIVVDFRWVLRER